MVVLFWQKLLNWQESLLSQHLPNVGLTLTQHLRRWPTIGSMSRVCWVRHITPYNISEKATIVRWPTYMSGVRRRQGNVKMTKRVVDLHLLQPRNESGFRPPLCTYRLNWARRTSWGWWDDTVLQTQDSKFEPWRSEAEHATSRSRRLPTILTFTRGWGRNIFVSFKPPRPGTEPRTLAWKAAVLTTTLGPPPFYSQELMQSTIVCQYIFI